MDSTELMKTPHQDDLERRVSPRRREAVPLVATVCISVSDLPGMRLLSLAEKTKRSPFRMRPDPKVGFAMVALRVLDGSLRLAFRGHRPAVDRGTQGRVSAAVQGPDALFHVHRADARAVPVVRVPGR